jgi:hypothetical protein
MCYIAPMYCTCSSIKIDKVADDLKWSTIINFAKCVLMPTRPINGGWKRVWYLLHT